MMRVTLDRPAHQELLSAFELSGSEACWEVEAFTRWVEKQPKWGVNRINERLGFPEKHMAKRCRECGYPTPRLLRRMVRVVGGILRYQEGLSLNQASFYVGYDQAGLSTATLDSTGLRPTELGDQDVAELAVRFWRDSNG